MKIFLLILKGLLLQKSLSQMRRQGLLYYLKTLQVIRRSIIGTLFFAGLFQLMLFGLLGAAGGLIILLPLSFEEKIYILIGFSSILFLLPFIFLCKALSEKTWYKASRAEELFQDEAA